MRARPVTPEHIEHRVPAGDGRVLAVAEWGDPAGPAVRVARYAGWPDRLLGRPDDLRSPRTAEIHLRSTWLRRVDPSGRPQRGPTSRWTSRRSPTEWGGLVRGVRRLRWRPARPRLRLAPRRSSRALPRGRLGRPVPRPRA